MAPNNTAADDSEESKVDRA